MSRWLPLFPPSASTISDRLDLLFVFLLASSCLITIVVVACLVVFSVKFRRRPGNEVARQISGSWKLETTWTVIPLCLAMIPFFWGATLYFDMSTPPDNSLDVRIVARQWMWKAEHPGGQSEIDEIHVPAGEPVRVTMISQDVIHSFFVPDFRVKMDVLPGRYTTAWFTATKPGRYRLECAEFCGLDHSQMTGWIVVMDPADFANWLATQGTQSLASQGERLFQQLGCNGCHRTDSLSRAPDLTGLYGQPVRLQDGSQVQADDNYIRTSILNPSAQVVDGWQPIMPTFQGQLSEEQILALIAYVRSTGPQRGAPAPELRPSPPPRPPVGPYSAGTPPPSPLPSAPLLPAERAPQPAPAPSPPGSLTR
ncbi:MAG: cytochrome c oxidase subunit II [Chloroflexota bacterium]